MESTEFDKHLVGTQKTYPEDEHENITDSASAATAMSANYIMRQLQLIMIKQK